MSVSWKDVASAVGSAAPLLGTLLGGPAGGAVGAVIASALGSGGEPGEVLSALKLDPESAVKLKQIEKDRQVELQQLAVTQANNLLLADVATIQSINATMQAEAASENWMSSSWRPFCGFVFGVTFFGVYFVLPLASVPVPTVPTEAWMSIGAVLGVASWFRGKAQADPHNMAPIKG